MSTARLTLRVFVLVVAVAVVAPSSVHARSPERVVLFASYASPTSSGWSVHANGWLYKPYTTSFKRRLALAAFRRMVGLVKSNSYASTFDQRAGWFFTVNLDKRSVRAQLGRYVYSVGRTDSGGHFERTLEISKARARAIRHSPRGWAKIWVKRDGKWYRGYVQFVPSRGVSVISDIDDTIKITGATSKKELLANTFFRPFRSVSGMANVYRRWASRGAVFHYVTGSPWQIYPPLSAYLSAQRFPLGAFHMKPLTYKNFASLSTFLRGDQIAFKRNLIEGILRAFPRRRFVFVGDAGEKDPEIYVELAKHHPSQVIAVLIRDTGGQAARVKRLFAGLPKSVRSRVFHTGSEIASLSF